jgi:predicted RNA-binding protein (virulence factor B family)
VQVADLWLRFGDHFAVEIENDTEHSMSGRVRGTEVQGHRFSQ